ncbi:MAG TPA: DoxX family membrane protein [Pseudonocardiaceae bacterium]|nr:DoxX family membrane protein [Pseudonocardiaceae bacterium]
MSIKDNPTSTNKPAVPVQQSVVKPTAAAPVTEAGSGRYQVLAVLRVVTGLMFLWAFVDKAFGWGYSTSSNQAWINGGSPTKGFLAHVEVGPFQSMLRDWAGTGWANWLFMLALFGVGLALVLGIGMRVAAVSGTLLLALMWIAEWPLARFDSTGAATSSTNPIIDYHFIYIFVVIALAVFAAGNTWGFGRQWAKLDIVARNPWLR